MFVYCQKSGEFWRVNGLSDTAGEPISDTGMYGTLLGVGYSGRNVTTPMDVAGVRSHYNGRNEPSLQGISNVGPIPQGAYTIEHAETHPVLGPVALPLRPEAGNQMFNRGDFWIHGDNAAGDASHGCIILDRNTRNHVANNVSLGNDHLLVMA